MRENPFGSDGAHAGADLQAERTLSLLQGLGTWLARVLVQQVFEHRVGALEAACGHVGHSGRESVTSLPIFFCARCVAYGRKHSRFLLRNWFRLPRN
jgi:hypothetical protein